MMGDDERQLLRALRNLGADYEPDVAAISRRVGNGHLVDSTQLGDPVRPERLGDRLRLVPDRRPAEARAPGGLLRSNRPLLLPAAAVLLLFGGVVLATSFGRTDPDPGHASAQPIATAVPVPPTSARATPPEPSRPGTTTPRSSTGSTRVAVPPPDPKSDPTGTAVRRARVSVLSAVQAGTAVDLSRPPLTDWLALGTRSDLKQVRAKAGVTDGGLSLDQPAAATSTNGPFTTSWTAGLPEQSHDDAAGWLSVDGKSGLTVTVAGSDQPRTVVLYAGTEDLRGSLSVSGPGVSTDRTTLGPAAPGGIVITVELPPTTGPTLIRLGGNADGPVPMVHLAAVTLARTPR